MDENEHTANRGIFNEEEVEFIRSLRRDYEKGRWIRFSGMFTLLMGLGIGVTPYLSDTSEAYLPIGLFFACLGIMTLRETLRTRKLYEIIRKLMPSNMEI
jgi:uncharacterized membrane protein HdeD (DUF308 family)